MLTCLMIILSMFLLGVAVCYYVTKRSYEKNIVGKLKIDTSDPDGPYLFLELDKNIGELNQREYVTLKVDVSNYLSQK